MSELVVDEEGRELVCFVRGPLDGIVGAIAPMGSALGFVVWEEPNATEPDDPWLFGYFDTGLRSDGRRIFAPGPRGRG